MKTIRHNIFESNSSSSHSISVIASSYRRRDTISHLVEKSGVIKIDRGEFGWGVNDFSDAYTKLSYWVTRYCPDHLEEDDIRKNLILLQKAIKTETGKSYNIEVSGEGYIDHQSQDIEVPFHNIRELREFIFDKNTILHIDNDNH